MNTIRFQNRKWALHSATDKRLIFHPADGAGALFVKWRKAKKLNQRDAAAHLGISQPQLARIENGTRQPQAELLERIQGE